MATITRFSPLDDLLADFNRGYWVRPLNLPAETEVKLKIDVKEDEKSFTVHADIPGVKKEDIHVEVDNNQVTIRAEVKQEKEEKKGEKIIHSERTYGMASRSFTLSSDVDASAVKAEYKDGVLNLTLPKKANGAAKRITVS